jgi:acyl-CoA thioesterase-2
MRAAGAEATHPRPVSFFCHFLGPLRFDAAELRVSVLRRGRSAESLRVMVRQGDRDVLEATVCAAAENTGLEHEVATPPDVPGPDELMSLADYYAEPGARQPVTPFWTNFDARPVHDIRVWPPAARSDPVWRQWHRLAPTATFADPWTDAARYVLLGDLPSWPSLVPYHAWEWPEEGPGWTAPTLDLYVAFHHVVPDEPWLLVDGTTPVAADGLLGCHTRIWTPDGRLVTTGGGQGFFRRIPPS